MKEKALLIFHDGRIGDPILPGEGKETSKKPGREKGENRQMATKKTSGSKKVIAGIACALALILAGGIAGGLLQHHYNWGADKPKVEDSTGGDKENPGDSTDKPQDTGGSEVNTESGEAQNMKLTAARLMSSQYEDYGVSPLAETAYTLTATITPADAANKKIDWTIAFKNASSTWASGKTVTEYATVTPSADGAMTAVVANVAEFGEQIVVKATSRDNPDAYATCTVEYLQRTTGYTFKLNGNFNLELSSTSSTGVMAPDFATSPKATPTITVNKSTVYTRTNTDKATYYTMTPTQEFQSSVSSMKVGLGVPGVLKTYEGASGGSEQEYFGTEWGKSVYGTSAAGKNGFISLIGGYSNKACYEVKIYTEKSGTLLATFNINFDATKIKNQKAVESVRVDDTEIVF